jgi:hypothetical protein
MDDRVDRTYDHPDPLSPTGVWAGIVTITDATHSRDRGVRWRSWVLWSILAFPFAVAGGATIVELAQRALD